MWALNFSFDRITRERFQVNRLSSPSLPFSFTLCAFGSDYKRIEFDRSFFCKYNFQPYEERVEMYAAFKRQALQYLSEQNFQYFTKKCYFSSK